MMTRPPTAFDEQRRKGPQHIRRAGEIDIDLIVPIGVLHFEDRLERLNSGIGEENVDATEILFDLRGRGA